MGKFDQDRNAWSGLLSGNKYAWQEGLRIVCAEVGGFQFHSSSSGYEGWLDVVKAARKRLPKRMLWLGHSNGGYAITAGADALKGLPIEHVIVCFDRTVKACPPLGANVIAAMDMWAGLANLKRGDDFNGVLVRKDFSEHSHIGVIGSEKAQKMAIAFLREWSVA